MPWVAHAVKACPVLIQLLASDATALASDFWLLDFNSLPPKRGFANTGSALSHTVPSLSGFEPHTAISIPLPVSLCPETNHNRANSLRED